MGFLKDFLISIGQLLLVYLIVNILGYNILSAFPYSCTITVLITAVIYFSIKLLIDKIKSMFSMLDPTKWFK